jgi:hypothetical protein
MNGEFYFIASTTNYGKEIFKMNNLLTRAEKVNRTAQLSISPNPSNGIIKMNKNYKSVYVFDVLGKNVFEVYDTHETIDLTSLSDGMYILKTLEMDNSSGESKLIISK